MLLAQLLINGPGGNSSFHSVLVVGALGAIMQNDIKRMMAYSSIAHMGYALAGLASGTQQGALGVVIYDGYIFMGAGSFAILLMRRDGQAATKIGDLQGLSRTHPMLALGMMVMMFSMAGIPPLAGFFGVVCIFGSGQCWPDCFGGDRRGDEWGWCFLLFADYQDHVF